MVAAPKKAKKKLNWFYGWANSKFRLLVANLRTSFRPLSGYQSLKVWKKDGVIAQLGERLHGMQEVGGSIPPGSTNSTGSSVMAVMPSPRGSLPSIIA